MLAIFAERQLAFITGMTSITRKCPRCPGSNGAIDGIARPRERQCAMPFRLRDYCEKGLQSSSGGWSCARRSIFSLILISLAILRVLRQPVFGVLCKNSSLHPVLQKTVLCSVFLCKNSSLHGLQRTCSVSRQFSACTKLLAAFCTSFLHAHVHEPLALEITLEAPHFENRIPTVSFH